MNLELTNALCITTQNNWETINIQGIICTVFYYFYLHNDKF